MAQSPIQCLLCSQVLVSDLRRPRLTPRARDRGPSSASVAEPKALVAAGLFVHIAEGSRVALGTTAQTVTLRLEAAAAVEAWVVAADPAGQGLAVGLGALALALGHACRLKPMPLFILMEELEKLGLEALLSLTVLPSEVFWTDAARAVWHVHTGAAPLAGVVCAAVVLHFLGLQAVSPSLVLVKVGGSSTPGPEANSALAGALVIQLPAVLEREVAGLPSDSEKLEECLPQRKDFINAC